MGAPTSTTCTPPSTQPPDYAKQLNHGVPPVEGKPTPLYPTAKAGPAERTWYFPIDIGVSSFHATGVFIPQDFSYGAQVDVILYFHGNKQGDFKTIDKYWNGKLHGITLREDLNASGKNAILVAPTLGENPGHGLRSNEDLGIFVKSGAGLTYLDEVMTWLGKYEPGFVNACVVPKVRKVVLAGHSGGGSAIVLQMESMKAVVGEIWAFDVVYWKATDWIHFAQFNPTKQVTIYHAIQSLDTLKQIIKLKEKAAADGRPLDNLEILKGANHHFPCLTDNFGAQAKRSKGLNAR